MIGKGGKFGIMDGRLVVLGFNATLTAKVILCVFLLSQTSTDITFLSKATDYFSHMLLQM